MPSKTMTARKASFIGLHYANLRDGTVNAIVHRAIRDRPKGADDAVCIAERL